jgi:hypothetical protein
VQSWKNAKRRRIEGAKNRFPGNRSLEKQKKDEARCRASSSLLVVLILAVLILPVCFWKISPWAAAPA